MELKLILVTLLTIALVLTPGIVFAQDDAETILISAGDEVELEDPGILPDNPFYILKTFTERIRLMTAFSQEAKLRVQMKLAEKRLAEAERMMLNNKTEHVERLMTRYQEHVESAEQSRERLQQRNMTMENIDEYMNQTTSKHISVLRRVIERAPEQAQSGLQNAMQKAETNRENTRTRITDRIQRRREQTEATTGTETGTEVQIETEADAEAIRAGQDVQGTGSQGL